MANVYLVGFMGTGKTAVAKLLAKRLNRAFVDMDELIVEREKMTIPEIFKTKGEPYFRSLEKGIVKEFASQVNLVVACGGGTFVDADNIAALKKSGIVICLESSPETILERTSRFAHRPLLNVKNPKARIQELLAERASAYAQAHHILDADQLTPEETAREVLKLLTQHDKS